MKFRRCLRARQSLRSRRCESDPLPYGRPANEKAIGMGLEFAFEQKLTREKYTYESFVRAVRKSGQTLYRELAAFPVDACLSQVVTIQLHHLAPNRPKLFYKQLLRVVACKDFRDGAQLRV